MATEPHDVRTLIICAFQVGTADATLKVAHKYPHMADLIPSLEKLKLDGIVQMAQMGYDPRLFVPSLMEGD